jgi:hypothetical protein
MEGLRGIELGGTVSASGASVNRVTQSMLARICSFAAELKRVLVVHFFGSAAPPSTVHSMAFENALVSKMRERVDLEEVSSIIEAHSGTIRVEDTDGDSVQFQFTLPATEGSAK